MNHPQAVTQHAIRHSKTKERPVCVRHLRCSGRMHAISWRVGGTIKLHHHTKANIEAMLVARDMGAKCPCVEFLLAVRNRSWEDPLVKKSDFARACTVARAARSWRKRPEHMPYAGRTPLPKRRDRAASNEMSEMHNIFASQAGRLNIPTPTSENFAVRSPSLFITRRVVRPELHLMENPFFLRDGTHISGALKLGLAVPLLWARWMNLGLVVVAGRLVVDVRSFSPHEELAEVTLAEVVMDAEKSQYRIESRHATVRRVEKADSHTRWEVMP